MSGTRLPASIVKINNIKLNLDYNTYILLTIKHIDNYNKILNTPIRMSFTGKIIKDDKPKKDIVNSYLEVIRDVSFLKDKNLNIPMKIVSKRSDKFVCEDCDNVKNFDYDDNFYTCVDCGNQKEIYQSSTYNKDSSRAAISSKYSYDRKIHFRDCISQYQGKQNSTIDSKIYVELEKQFLKHDLLLDTDVKKIKFSKVTKQHVMMFLKDLGYTKHYENVNLIYSVMTGNKLDDISHLEEILMQDFDTLLDTYDKMYKDVINRTNFINTQYILFQLLRRHRHPCSKEDFSMLKTTDRQYFHDDITSKLFNANGWNMRSLYG